MILTIAAKEFLANLLTWRFGLAVAASIVLLSVSAVVLRADYARRLDAHEAELARIRADLEDIKVYAQLEETVSRPPSPLSVFSEGLEKRMGTILRFSHAKVPTMLTWKKETNPLVAAFPPFDLATVAGLLFSLMALFFAFDAVSGEQEGNTLKLMAANRVARWKILVGKWLGGGACSLLPAALGFLVATLILAGSPQVSLSGAQWLRVGLIFAAVVLYTSAFYLVGLAVSSRARQSGTALVACIAVWAGCTIVAPAMVPYVVGEVVPLPPERELRAQWEEIDHRLGKDFHRGLHDLEKEFARQMEPGYWGLLGVGQTYSTLSVGSVAGYYRLYREAVPFLTGFYRDFEPRRMAAAKDIAELEDRLVNGQTRQVRITHGVSRLFVAPAFRGAVSALAGTDLRSFEEFIAHARRHRAALAAWMREQGLFTSVLFYSPVPEDRLHSRQETLRRWKWNLQWPPGGHGVDRSRVPRFPDYRPAVATLFGGAAPDLTVLLAANGLAFFLGLRWFTRRQIG